MSEYLNLFMQDAEGYAAIKKVIVNHDDCTDFQIHTTSNRSVIDFTQHKLKAYASKLYEPRQKATILFVLKQYIGGHIAVAWRAGEPVWRKIIDGK